MKTKYLMPGIYAGSPKEMQDLFVIISRNIEAGLVHCGFEGGKDYTALDLFKLAQPFVLEKFKKLEVDFQKEWPEVKE